MNVAPDVDAANAGDLDGIANDIGHIFQLIDMGHDIYVELDHRKPLTEQTFDTTRLSALLWIARDRLNLMDDRITGLNRRMRTTLRMKGEAAVDRSDTEVCRIEAIFRRFENHRLAWEASSNADGNLMDNHPDMVMTTVIAHEFAAFPVRTAEGMRTKARLALSSDLLRSDIFECVDDAGQFAFLRSIAGEEIGGTS